MYEFRTRNAPINREACKGHGIRIAHLSAGSAYGNIFRPHNVLSKSWCMGFAENLKKLMKRRSMSARELSRATSVPLTTISQWTTGQEPKMTEQVLRVSQHLGTSLEELIQGEGAATPSEDFVKSLLNAEGGFVAVHEGIYRIKVEKLRGGK
jgi:transcriptional regulator with XRE-family HTH domain